MQATVRDILCVLGDEGAPSAHIGVVVQAAPRLARDVDATTTVDSNAAADIVAAGAELPRPLLVTRTAVVLFGAKSIKMTQRWKRVREITFALLALGCPFKTPRMGTRRDFLYLVDVGSTPYPAARMGQRDKWVLVVCHRLVLRAGIFFDC